jgi:serine-type D-Ala-D-Ala carboxypeptidase/endopeptidase (penicillin-binding protein 4)
MKKGVILVWLFLHFTITNAQKLNEVLDQKFLQLQKAPTLKHAIISFTVIDANTGEMVFEKNSEIGLPTASTQKIITSICAYELLGSDFKFETNFYALANNMVLINGSYDPTLGSWRYTNTQPDLILKKVKEAAAKHFKNKLPITIVGQDDKTNTNIYSDAWTNEDMNTYYGAPTCINNWRENQIDINIKPQGTSTIIESIIPAFGINKKNVHNTVTVTQNEAGDNTRAFRLPGSMDIYLNGTMGSELKTLECSISSFGLDLLQSENNQKELNGYESNKQTYTNKIVLYKHNSPSLDSINYWFLKKSINLYGESLLRTMAIKKYNTANYKLGIQYIHSLCHQLNIDTAAVHIFDGCGLSPQNRISTKALTTFMQYARSKNYYNSFYNSLPIIHDISMKSGSIHGARAYTGYINSKADKVYTFAIAVNNYDGGGKIMQAKLWQILDVLKEY